MNATQRNTAKQIVDEVMGARAGDGCGPTEAAAIIAERIGVVLTPRQTWNLWIDGDEN